MCIRDRYSVDLNDNVTKMTQANGGEYTYSYDKAGRLKSMTSPLGYTCLLYTSHPKKHRKPAV